MVADVPEVLFEAVTNPGRLDVVLPVHDERHPVVVVGHV